MAQKRMWEVEDQGDDLYVIGNDWDDKEFLTDNHNHATWLEDMLNHIEAFVGDES